MPFGPASVGLAAEFFPDLWSHLTDDGQRRFVDELLHTASVRDVVDAWYRTLLIRTSPDYEAHMEEDLGGQPKLTAKQIRRRLRV